MKPLAYSSARRLPHGRHCGVVNHRGELFEATSARDGLAAQPGLHVADASISPTALGNDPLLTITALAERIADLMLRDPRTPPSSRRASGDARNAASLRISWHPSAWTKAVTPRCRSR